MASNDIKESSPSAQAESAQVELLAREMLEQTRETLAMTFRYLDIALWHMPFEPREFDAPLATDGMTLFFDPYRVVARFKQSPDDLVRDYLHLLFDQEWTSLSRTAEPARG